MSAIPKILTAVGNMNIRSRLYLGFSALTLLLVLIVSITIYQLNYINQQTHRIDELRVPTATASSALVKNIYASLASLRGYILTGDEIFKTQLADEWTEIDALQADMDTLSTHWSKPENIQNWNDFKVALEAFRNAQTAVEDITNSPEQYPATVLFAQQALPLATAMSQAVTGHDGRCTQYSGFWSGQYSCFSTDWRGNL